MIFKCHDCESEFDEKYAVYYGTPGNPRCPVCGGSASGIRPADLPEAGASAERICSVVRLLPCPFCGKQPKEYWDYESTEHEMYNEGYNITCCVVHITAIYKHDAIEHWNTRQ